MAHSDQKYVNALVNNDPVLIEEIYKKFFGKIKWMILQNNGDITYAADIFQEALLTIFNKSKTQNFTLTCPLEAFLYQVCKRKWMKELKKRKKGKYTSDDVGEYNNVEDCFKISEEHRLKEERRNLFIEKLEELNESCRQLLKLNLKGKSLLDVAKTLNLTYINVRIKKVRCMAKLMMLIKQSPRYKSLKW